MLGLDLERWTLRRIDRALRAKRDDDWNHTALVCWLTAEIHRDRKRGGESRPEDWHLPTLIDRQNDPAAKPIKPVMTREWIREQAREYYRRKGQPIPPELLGE